MIPTLDPETASATKKVYTVYLNGQRLLSTGDTDHAATVMYMIQKTVEILSVQAELKCESEVVYSIGKAAKAP